MKSSTTKEKIPPLLETFDPLTTNVPHYIETSKLISNANQLNAFYMMGNIGC